MNLSWIWNWLFTDVRPPSSIGKTLWKRFKFVALLHTHMSKIMTGSFLDWFQKLLWSHNLSTYDSMTLCPMWLFLTTAWNQERFKALFIRYSLPLLGNHPIINLHINVSWYERVLRWFCSDQSNWQNKMRNNSNRVQSRITSLNPL